MEDVKSLIAAFFESNSAGLRLLSAAPDLITARTGLGETALHYLAVENQLEAVRTLVEYGAEVNTVNKCGGTPLSEAASLGYVDLVRYLLAVGAQIHVEGQGEPTLNCGTNSGNTEIVRMLLNTGADVNIRNDIGETPLHLAAGKDNLELVQLLVNCGADIRAKRIFDETPLEVAEYAGAVATAKYLSQLESVET